MSDTHAQRTPATDRRTGHAATGRDTAPTGWVGWIIFAGVTMIVLGGFQVIEGLVAVFERGYYRVSPGGLIVHVNYNAWGWTHFSLGVLIVLVGFGVLAGMTWARVVGIALAVISAIVSLAFIPAYPVWGVIVIALDIVVIYALATHGREMQSM